MQEGWSTSSPRQGDDATQRLCYIHTRLQRATVCTYVNEIMGTRRQQINGKYLGAVCYVINTFHLETVSTNTGVCQPAPRQAVDKPL